MHKGFFITFEGIEGSGKSTQIKLAYEKLVKDGYKVLLTKEPGGTRASEKIRELLLDTNMKGLLPRSELLLLLASRAQHVEEVILKELKLNTIILCDRFADSSFAYQGYGRGLSLYDIESLNAFASLNLTPDLTILFDIDPDKTFDRIAFKKHDRFEIEAQEFHKKVRQGYLELAKQHPHRIHVVNGVNDREVLHKTIIDVIVKKIAS